MNKEELIIKWLDDALNAEELVAFKKLEDYDDLIKLSDNVKLFKAPEYNVSNELDSVLNKLDSNTKSNTHWTKYMLRIAAIFIVGFSLYYYTITLDTNISTLTAQKTSIELPDDSQASLNALTEISFNKNSWSKNREISLNGEAFFKVTKGSSFNVLTPTGTITVLGTQFNVKHRDHLFEVVCYEGSVKVIYNEISKVLNPGDNFLILDGKLIATEKENKQVPSWINNESYFKSMPLSYVINEFERQYNITINTKRIDLDQLYTGSFSHKNKELALKSITLPLNLKYSLLKDNSVVLTRE